MCLPQHLENCSFASELIVKIFVAFIYILITIPESRYRVTKFASFKVEMYLQTTGSVFSEVVEPKELLQFLV